MASARTAAKKTVDVYEALGGALERDHDTAPFLKTLERVVPHDGTTKRRLGKHDAQALLGLTGLALGRYLGKRGTSPAHALIAAVLARWPRLPDGAESQRDVFLQNALAVVGAKNALVRELEAVLPPKPAQKILFNLACTLAVAGDKTRASAAIARTLASGTRPAHLERDRELRKILSDPDIAAVVDRHRPRPPATGASPPIKAAVAKRIAAALDELEAVYVEDRERRGPKLPARQARRLSVVRAPRAKRDAIRAAEAACKVRLPDDYRAFLEASDGANFGNGDLDLLGTADLHGKTTLGKSAREYLSISADYGSPELLECVPIANMGEPNDWILYDPRKDKYLYCLNADRDENKDLATCVRRVTDILRDVLSDA